MVRDEQTGLKFVAGDEYSLSETLQRLLSSSAPVDVWGQNARLEYLSRYTPDASFETLMQIYRFARANDSAPAEDYQMVARS